MMLCLFPLAPSEARLYCGRSDPRFVERNRRVCSVRDLLMMMMMLVVALSSPKKENSSADDIGGNGFVDVCLDSSGFPIF